MTTTMTAHPKDSYTEELPGIAAEYGRSFLWCLASRVGKSVGAFVGLVAVWIALSVLATIPLLQFLSLGYLLESSGRIARTGRFSWGLIGLSKASRLGVAALMLWIMLWVPRFLASLWRDAELMDADSETSSILALATMLASAWVVFHASAAIWQGGRLRHFFWPNPIRFLWQVSAPGALRQAASDTSDAIRQLRLGSFFWIGLRGFLVGLAWLGLPTAMLIAGVDSPGVVLLGGVLLSVTVVHLPFLQARMASTGQLRDGFALRPIWRSYLRAPLWHSLAVVSTLLLAIPLYLLKIELTPPEATWLPSLLFVASIWPVRLLTGWALAQAAERPSRWWKTSIGVVSLILALAPVAMSYTLILFFTQFASWYGTASLFEQHAFLLPAPFLGG